MLELTADNALDYLRSTGRLDDPAAHVEVLAGGVSNLVLRVTAASGVFVLKQSRPQLRTRDAWFSDLDRIYREQEVMQALEPRLPAGTVPRLLFVDRDNFLFAMSHAPFEAVNWKQELLAGRVEPSFGTYVGRVLGLMHEASARDRATFERFADATVFVQLRVDPFYRKLQQRLPDVAQPLQQLIDQMLTRRDALCHGDYTPKNMLVHAGRFTLVDYETAYFGDPAMDLGLCLAHLTLKSIRRPDQRPLYRQLMDNFWTGYAAEVHFASRATLEARAIPHLGACLLARVDGTSQVDYLTEEQRNEARALGRRLLQQGV